MVIGPAPDWQDVTWMIGNYNGTPTLVAVDAQGRMYAVLYGSVTVSGEVDVNQISDLREIQGSDGVGLHTIAVDELGRIIALIYGSYGGVMKTVAVDDQGRMIMIPTDPADVWGNAISMGNAELAAVLTPLKRFDRRGNILWWDDFEGGITKWAYSLAGTGAAVSLSAVFAVDGSYSCKITSPSDGDYMTAIAKDFAYPILSKFGFQFALTLHAQTVYVRWLLNFYTGSELYNAMVRYDYPNAKIQYYDNTGAWQDLQTGINLYQPDNCVHVGKLVIDGITKRYVRFLLDNNEYDMDAYSIREVANAEAARLTVQILQQGSSGNTPDIFIDDVIITQNEPANP